MTRRTEVLIAVFLGMVLLPFIAMVLVIPFGFVEEILYELDRETREMPLGQAFLFLTEMPQLISTAGATYTAPALMPLALVTGVSIYIDN